MRLKHLIASAGAVLFAGGLLMWIALPLYASSKAAQEISDSEKEMKAVMTSLEKYLDANGERIPTDGSWSHLTTIKDSENSVSFRYVVNSLYAGVKLKDVPKEAIVVVKLDRPSSKPILPVDEMVRHVHKSRSVAVIDGSIETRRLSEIELRERR